MPMVCWIRFYAFCVLILAALAPVASGEGPAKEDERPWLPPRKTAEQITPEEAEAMRKIASLFPAPEKAPGVPAKYFVRYGGQVTEANPAPPTRWDQLSEELIKRCRNTRNWSMLSQLALICHEDPTPEGRAKAKELYLDCARQFASSEGAAKGNTSYLIARVRFAANALAMKSVLQNAGLYEPLVRPFMMEGFMTAKRPALNMDASRSNLPLSWTLVANMEDGPEKLYRLRLLQRATSLSMARLFTPDGGGMHHRCDHIAYASYSVPPIVQLARKLHGTAFRLDDTARERLRAFARAHAFGTVGLRYPGNLNARAFVGDSGLGSLPGILRELAEMGAPDGSGPVDREMAALYLAKVTDRGDKAGQRHRKLGIEPATLSGHLSYNISAAALHRRGKWLVSIDGSRSDHRGVEIYASPGTGNSYARYSCFGSIMILATPDPKSGKITAAASGYRADGWNWSYFAGVTSAERTFDRLASKRPGYVRNNSSFGGGTSLGEDGIWGLDVVGDVKCRKSAFCFDNRITVLTSGIQPRNPKDRAVTTLFQLALNAPEEPVFVNGASISDFPYEQEFSLEEPVRLVDNRGNGYYVHDTLGETLRLRRSTQAWYYMSDMRPDAPEGIQKLRRLNRLTPEQLRTASEHLRPRRGDFALAFIDHSEKPSQKSCAFTIFVRQAPPEGALPYTILRQDQVAHILRDNPSRTTGYVVFEPEQELKEGPLRSSGRPCFFMARESEEGTLSCSVGSTDQKDRSPIVLRLRGRWTVVIPGAEDMECKQDGETTTVTIPYRDYMPVRFALREVE